MISIGGLKKSRTLISLVLVTAALFLGLVVVENIDEIKQYGIEYQWGMLIVVLGITLVGHLAAAYLWMWTTRVHKTPSLWSEAWIAWSLSRIARYIPGKVVSPWLRVILHKNQEKNGISLAVVTEFVASLVAVCMLAIFVSWVYVYPLREEWMVFVTALGGASIVLLFFPFWLGFAEAFIRKKYGNVSLRAYYPQPRHLLLLCVAQFPIIMIHGYAFFYLLASFEPISYSHFFFITSVYFLSGIAGQIVLFAPAGLGVREVTLYFLICGIVSEAQALISVILIRLILVASELMMSMFSILSLKRQGLWQVVAVENTPRR